MCVQLQKGEQSFISTSALCLERFHSRLPPSSLKKNCTQSPYSQFLTNSWQRYVKKVICPLFVALILCPSPLQVLSQWTRWPSRLLLHDQSSVFLFFSTGKTSRDVKHSEKKLKPIKVYFSLLELKEKTWIWRSGALVVPDYQWVLICVSWEEFISDLLLLRKRKEVLKQDKHAKPSITGTCTNTYKLGCVHTRWCKTKVQDHTS